MLTLEEIFKKMDSKIDKIYEKNKNIFSCLKWDVESKSVSLLDNDNNILTIKYKKVKK